MFTPTPREQFDRLQLAALAGLMCLGAAFVFSATMANEYSATLPWYSQSWVRQIVWYAMGIGAAAAVCVLDYNTLARRCQSHTRRFVAPSFANTTAVLPNI